MLAETLGELTVAKREQVTDALRVLTEHSATSSQAVQNLQAEIRLHAEAWLALVQALLSTPATVVAVKETITKFSRARQLAGPTVSARHHVIYCRATTVSKLSRLFVSLNYYATVQSARRAIRNILDKPADVIVARWRNLQLGRFILWSTFEIRGGRPFSGASSDYICGVLGLDRSEPGVPVLLFEYTLPPTVQPRFPTIADAYSSPSWPYFFRPAPAHAEWGLTMPWPEYSSEPPSSPWRKSITTDAPSPSWWVYYNAGNVDGHARD
jgi:hypothetical protein